MNQREKLLAAGVGVAVLGVASVFAISSVSSAFDARHNAIQELQKEVAKSERTVRVGQRAASRLNELRQISLPGDEALASALYSQWLLKKSVEVGFAAPNVTPTPGQLRSRPGLFDNLSFRIDAQADLEEVSRFLFEFYQVGYLHRISRVSLLPVAGKKDLKVNITVEALSLEGAENPAELKPPVAPKFADRKIEPYLDAIVGRNLFSPGNNPPKFASLGSPRAAPNRSLEFTVKATDPDSLDQLTYAFEGNPPDGAKLDPKSGQFRWTPPRVGEYEIAFRVTDDGLPRKSSIEKVKINVADPPPVVAEAPTKKKLDFDPAQHASLSAIVQSNGEWQVWVSVRTEGKILRLREGDRISVGSVNGTLKTVRPNQAEFGLDDGGSLLVDLGKTLATEG